MLTHHNLVANLCQVDGLEEEKRMGEDEIYSGDAAVLSYLWHGCGDEARACWGCDCGQYAPI